MRKPAASKKTTRAKTVPYDVAAQLRTPEEMAARPPARHRSDSLLRRVERI